MLVFSLKNSRPFSEREAAYLGEFLKEYARTGVGQWINDLPWREFEFRWVPGIRGSDILGAFTPIHPQTIYLADHDIDPDFYLNRGVRPYWIEHYLPTVCHELRHALQFSRNPVLYAVCSLPGIRQLTLERDADRVTEDADPIADEFAKLGAARDFEKTRKRLIDQEGA